LSFGVLSGSAAPRGAHGPARDSAYVLIPCYLDLDTGVLGAKYLLHALADNGRADVARRIAIQTTPPFSIPDARR